MIMVGIVNDPYYTLYINFIKEHYENRNYNQTYRACR